MNGGVPSSKSNALIIAVIAILTIVVVVGGCGLTYLSYHNGEIKLRKQVEAQQKSNEAVFDNTWKIIQQQANVTSEYKDSFKEIFIGMTEGRYGGENGRSDALLSFIMEHNPKFDASVFKQLMATIEAQRTAFTREQKKLIDLKREHDTLLAQFPGSLLLVGREPVDITVVTSSKTQQIFSTGVEDEVELFPKKPEQP